MPQLWIVAGLGEHISSIEDLTDGEYGARVLLTEAEAGLREVLSGHLVSNEDLMKTLSGNSDTGDDTLHPERVEYAGCT